MAAKSIKVEQLKQILRLHHQGYAIKRIARDLGISKTTIKKYLRSEHKDKDHNADGSINRVNPEALQDDTTGYLSNRYGKLIEYFKGIEKNPKNAGITRQQLWLEYKEAHPNGYNYRQYCYHFGEYTRHKEVVMHFDYDPAAEAMGDFARKSLLILIFLQEKSSSARYLMEYSLVVALLLCKAVPSQNTFDFNDCINAMLKYYGGSPKTIFCDNL